MARGPPAGGYRLLSDLLGRAVDVLVADQYTELLILEPSR